MARSDDAKALYYTNELLERLGRSYGLFSSKRFAFGLWHWIRFERATCDMPDGDAEDECGHGVSKP